MLFKTSEGITIDTKDLILKDDLISYLENNGENLEALKRCLQSYNDKYGSYMLFHYPGGLETYTEGIIASVNEGYLYLPICDDPNENNGTFIMDEVILLNEWAAGALYQEFVEYSRRLIAELSSISSLLRDKAGSDAVCKRDYSDSMGNIYYIFHNPLYGYCPMCRYKEPKPDTSRNSWYIDGLKVWERDNRQAQKALDEYAKHNGLIPVDGLVE